MDHTKSGTSEASSCRCAACKRHRKSLLVKVNQRIKMQGLRFNVGRYVIDTVILVYEFYIFIYISVT